ncbi:MAG: hypothetical protein RQ847_06440 [Wenzhouxiangellaceae bacterium]|nr:hypothetical protein [Wenzhouxiangellaceae bacterium]
MMIISDRPGARGFHFRFRVAGHARMTDRMIDYIALVRTAAPAEEIRDAVAAAARFGPALLFAHGDGVELAVADAFDGRDGVEAVVCSTSWRRRHAADPPPPWRRASLVALFERLDRSGRVDCFGRGPWLCAGPAVGAGPERAGVPAPGRGLLIEIAFAPDGPDDRTEALEFVLAAAALELDARVLFSGSGRVHLAGADARGWRQLVDFDLLELAAECPRESGLAIPVRQLDGAAARQWRGDAGCVVSL